jgi:hypothetical protein
MIMNTLQAVQAVRDAVATIADAVELIHAPVVHAIILATGEQDEQALTDVVLALKCEQCPWLFEQGKAFALTCVEGAEWQNGKFVVADDADELTLHPCADIKGATKWWAKIAKPAGKSAQSLTGKLSAFCKFLDKAGKRGGPALVAGETRAQAAVAAQAMALIASGAVSFEDVIALATLPVSDEVDAEIAAELKLVG